MTDTLEAVGPNAAQIDYWNAAGGASWVAQQDTLDAELQTWGETAMAALAPTPGERLIDVGCGCGATTLMLAERVGANGAVLGADISAPMLELARRRAAAAGLAQATFALVDAQTHRFEPTDGVYSRFGVMFFADPVAAFANLRAALTPRGRVTFVCWRAPEHNPWMMAPMAAIAPLLPEAPPAPPPGAPGPFAFADRDRVLGILKGAGFTKVEIEAHDLKTSWADLEASTRLTLRVGPVSAALRQHPQLADKIAEAVRAALAPYATPEGVRMDSSSWVARAEG
jgi:SAM-dependent methyltransferase